ncbi:SMI1/KNR4 family protein [Flavobacterium undicola]|uniref:SMI1/KNR4 family protein n=1 Tax=Flavobacterium undicola TaxID=1932779 RepID=UPI001377F9F8|nr:SMI1/KNR4 family protein [Flavobacterium undicola]MBA0885494.1 SMI1/KNR4 family protein [Flavobacterium undicola]
MENISIDKIIDQWTNKKIKLSPPSTMELIKATEEILSFQFPDDFKEFYLKLDGFADWDWTENMFSIWPLARIIEEYNNESDKNFIVFADYLINSHQYGFKKDQNGVFKSYGEQPEFIAETFSEIIFLINSDADILY